MESKGFDSNSTLSEESKQALQSESWNAVRESAKEKREVKHFTVEFTAGTDNVYGWTWEQVVKEYLRRGYSKADSNTEIVVIGEIYKILKRPEVTVFYDAAGNTLFDVENKRLEEEYELLMSNGAGAIQDHEESDEDNEDAKKNTAVDQKETDKEAGEVPQEERAADSEKEAQDDEEKQSDSVEDMQKDVVGKAADKNEKTAKYSGIDGAIAKLQEELKTAKPKEFADPIIGYLMGRCRESESIAADICQDHKSWKKCYDYIVAKARKKLNNVSGPVRDDVVFEWAEDYYHLDDKAEEEKKAKEDAERKKKQAETAKKRSNNRAGKKVSASDTEKKTSEVVNQVSKPEKSKKNNRDIEGQIDMFALMSM